LGIIIGIIIDMILCVGIYIMLLGCGVVWWLFSW